MKLFSKITLIKTLFAGLIFGFGLSCSSPQSDLITAGDIAVGQMESAEAKTRKKRRPSSVGSSKSKSSAKSAKRRSRSQAKRSKKKKRKKSKRKSARHVLDLPAVRKLRRSQAKRLDTIFYYKKQLLIGETDEGILAIRPAARMPASSKTKITEIVKAENRDRETLYKIVIQKERYNKKDQKVLREQFFESYRLWDPSGAYFSVDRAWQN